MSEKKESSIFWYDLETFGLNPRVDRIAQFAGVRTDLDLNPIEDPIISYCKITPDFLPDPLSCLVTGITPQETLRRGVSENQFITQINEEFSCPNTCVVGYNNIKFDDEFIRFTLYRNLLDPYSREYANQNSRWDLLPVVRMTYDLRPEGIVWPLREDGCPTFVLEKIAEANGVKHEKAHDALSDVYATIGIARLIKEKQPKLFEYIFSNRKKEKIRSFMDVHSKKPFLLTSSIFYSENGFTRIVSPVAVDMKQRNRVLCLDLSYDPTPLLELEVDELRRRIFTCSEVLEKDGLQPVRIVEVRMNQSPTIAPLTVLSKEEDRQRLGLDFELCEKHYNMIKDQPDLIIKLLDVFQGEKLSGEQSTADCDQMLYSGDFFNDADRTRMNEVRSMEPEDILSIQNQFDDFRLPEMVWRFVCRNYPKQLDTENLKRWKSFCAGRVLNPVGDRIIDINFYERKILEKLNDKNVSSEDKLVLKDLMDYGRIIREKVLTGSSQ